MSKIKALEQEVKFLRSQNEDLRDQLTALKEHAAQLFRDKNRRIEELESQLKRNLCVEKN